MGPFRQRLCIDVARADLRLRQPFTGGQTQLAKHNVASWIRDEIEVRRIALLKRAEISFRPYPEEVAGAALCGRGTWLLNVEKGHRVIEQVQNRQQIRHVVLFSSKDPDNVDAIIDGLSMLADIPAVSHFEVSRNRHEDRFSNEVDVVVYAEFEDAAALAAYRAHPIYQKCIEIVRPLREMRVAADF